MFGIGIEAFMGLRFDTRFRRRPRFPCVAGCAPAGMRGCRETPCALVLDLDADLDVVLDVDTTVIERDLPNASTANVCPG